MTQAQPTEPLVILHHVYIDLSVVVLFCKIKHLIKSVYNFFLERTEKLPMNSIKAVHSEAIVGNEEYHILVSYCHCTVLLYLIKDGTQSFIVLLVCKRIDRNTFCMKHGSTLDKKYTSVNAFTTP